MKMIIFDLKETELLGQLANSLKKLSDSLAGTNESKQPTHAERVEKLEAKFNEMMTQMLSIGQEIKALRDDK